MNKVINAWILGIISFVELPVGKKFSLKERKIID